jgi:hypothetical protein
LKCRFGSPSSGIRVGGFVAASPVKDGRQRSSKASVHQTSLVRPAANFRQAELREGSFSPGFRPLLAVNEAVERPNPRFINLFLVNHLAENKCLGNLPYCVIGVLISAFDTPAHRG